MGQHWDIKGFQSGPWAPRNGGFSPTRVMANIQKQFDDGLHLGGVDLSAVEGLATVRLGRVNVGTLDAPVWLEGAEARAWLERAVHGAV